MKAQYEIHQLALTKLMAEFEAQAAGTARLLSCVPDGRLGWRPHARSMTLGRLASHVAEIARYGSLVLASDRLDSEVRSRGPLDLDSVAAILEVFAADSADFLAALSEAGSEALGARWQYCKGDRVLLEVSRETALKRFVLNHSIHHRGQLTVYLRLLDIPLPQLYGPTADDLEGW